MNDSENRQDGDRTPPQSTRSLPIAWPLSRRAFAGWLGLASSLGLSGAAYRGADARQQTTPPAATQQDRAAGTGPRTLGLGIVGLHVADLGASLAFYRRLGLAIPTDVDLAAGAFRLPLPTGQVFFWETIEYTRRDFPDYEQGTGDRKVSLEFGFRTPEEVDEMYAALVAEGHGSYKEPLSWGFIRYAGVVDPDGNQISLRFPLAP